MSRRMCNAAGCFLMAEKDKRYCAKHAGEQGKDDARKAARMTGPEIDRLVILGRAGRLTPVEQGQLADIADEYQGHAHRLERWVHDSVKMLENVEL